jgi:preprotein translocase subunit YajC
MLIAKAYAQAVDAAAGTADGAVQAMAATGAPSTAQTFIWNMGLVMLMVALFYVLLIRPQQRRFKEHSEMLAGLQKGDKVVTGGGIIGTIEKITDGSDEVVVDLGNGVKVTALRSTLSGKNDARLKGKPANDQKSAAKDKENKS